MANKTRSSSTHSIYTTNSISTYYDTNDNNYDYSKSNNFTTTLAGFIASNNPLTNSILNIIDNTYNNNNNLPINNHG